MRSVVLLAVCASVLRGCGGDPLDSSDNPQGQADTPNAMSDSDPFVEGNSYRFVMTAKSTPGLEKSSAAVKVFIRELVSHDPEPTKKDDAANTGTGTGTNTGTSTDTGTGTGTNTGTSTDTGTGTGTGTGTNTGTNTSTDSSTSLAADAEVQLSWVCGDKQQRGNEKVKMRRLDAKLDVTLTELPALKRIDDSVKCTINASLDTTSGDGERVIATGSHEFYIEMDVLYPALRLHDVEITAGTEADARSAVAFKVSLIRQGKVVVQGDPVFDDEVEVALTWACNDAPLAKDRSKSDTPTDLTIAAGQAEAATQLSLPSTALGEGGYACVITATAEIDGYDHDVEGKKKLWIEGKDLQVAVTSVSSTSLSYVVMKRYQRLSGNVKLGLAYCTGVTIGGGNSQVASQGSVALTGTSTSSVCQLKAQVMTGDVVSREGVSRAFSMPSALR